MKFQISRNSVGDVINYIARDPFGNVRLRESTLKKMGLAIAEFNKREEDSKLKKNLHVAGGQKAEEKPKTPAEISSGLSVDETGVEEPKKIEMDKPPKEEKVASPGPTVDKKPREIISKNKKVVIKEITPQRNFYGYRRSK